MEALKKSANQPEGPLATSPVGSSGGDDDSALLSLASIFPEPVTPRRPQSLLKMPDEILEFYAFIFRQRGFRGLGMTFEQFLEVIEALRPEELRTSHF